MNDWIVEVDKSDKLIGKIEREVAHDFPNLGLHRETMLVLYTDSTHGKFLLQHRSMKKKQLPGLWTLSVTGHVDFDDLSDEDPEGYLTAASREAKEEIGVSTIELEIKGKMTQKNGDNWSMMGIVTGEYEGELKLDAEEVSEVNEFTKETIAAVSDKLTPGAKMCLEYLGILKS
jgi:isopentenyldiphosphate isomerase